jgi:flagellin-like protein
MQLTARRAVSPIIATLLLIAIAVAAGIIVYVFTSSITGNLTQGGGTQVSEQVSMDAYTFVVSGAGTCTGAVANPCAQVVLRNVGSSTVTISQIYVDGNLCQTAGAFCQANPVVTEPASSFCSGATPTITCATGTYATFSFDMHSSTVTAGSSHLLRVVTSDGGTFTFSVIGGRSG